MPGGGEAISRDEDGVRLDECGEAEGEGDEDEGESRVDLSTRPSLGGSEGGRAGRGGRWS